jgi:hypothetical protein
MVNVLGGGFKSTSFVLRRNNHFLSHRRNLSKYRLALQHNFGYSLFMRDDYLLCCC